MRTMKLFAAAIAVSVIAGPALASDLPTTKGPPAYLPPPAVFTWTGVYVGGQVGYQWGDSSTTLFPDLFNIGLPGYEPNGVTGGVHVGYNYQMGQFVFGLEGDANGLSYYGSNTLDPITASFTYSTRETVDGSIRGRVGYAWDHALFYATGGLAIGEFNNTYNLSIAYYETLPVDPTFTASRSVWTTRVGWTVGGGVEYALDNNWSVRGEYRYTDYGYFNELQIDSTGYDWFRKHETDNKVQIGFSYKFDLFAPPAPVVAKY
ncbi:MAG: outer membrane protein [Methylovirgula sp.]